MPQTNAAVQPAGVAPVRFGVPGGDDVVEAEGVGQGGDQVDGRGGGQHQRAALGPVGGQHLEGPGLDQVHQGLDGPLAGPAGGLRRPVAHDRGRGPGQADEGDRLAEPVVEPVHEAVPGQVAPGRQHPLGLHGLVEDGPAGRPDQGAVQIDEDGTGGSDMPSRYRRAGTDAEDRGTSWHRRRDRWTEIAPGRGKGTARGGGGPFALTQQG